MHGKGAIPGYTSCRTIGELQEHFRKYQGKLGMSKACAKADYLWDLNHGFCVVLPSSGLIPEPHRNIADNQVNMVQADTSLSSTQKSYLLGEAIPDDVRRSDQILDSYVRTDLYANNAYQHVLANLIHPPIPDGTDTSSSEYSQDWPLLKKQEYLDSVDPNTLSLDVLKRITKDRQLITGLTVPVNSRALGRLPAREATIWKCGAVLETKTLMHKQKTFVWADSKTPGLKPPIHTHDVYKLKVEGVTPVQAKVRSVVTGCTEDYYATDDGSCSAEG